MSGNEKSKYIALILRHKPEVIDITLDEHGWANVDELLEGINKTQALSFEELEKIVQTDEKQRYSFNEDKTLIRANQGHSVPVDVELEILQPPKHLYHGTAEKYVSSIEEQGLIPKSRLYVHLSGDYDTAVKVGSRHGKPVVYKISADKMARNGYVFYRSVNGVWLTKSVPPQYFKRESFEEPVVAAIKRELLAAFRTEEEPEEFVEENIIPKYGWEYVQQGLFRILLDDACTKADYSAAASIIYGAVLSGQKIKKKTAIGLLYYRLGSIAAPYDNDTIWSIAAKLYCLDFCNSDYNPLKDEKILRKLAEYGITLS